MFCGWAFCVLDALVPFPSAPVSPVPVGGDLPGVWSVMSVGGRGRYVIVSVG